MPSARLLLTTVLLLSCDASTSPPHLRVYTVGDETLSHIALKTGVSVAKLRSMNHLEGDLVLGGSGLLVPEDEKTLALPQWRPLLPAPEWKACPQVEWVRPEPTENERCRCAGEACFCLPVGDEDEAHLTFGPASGHRRQMPEGDLSERIETASWKSEVFPTNDANAFRHAKVDLDGDGQPESVISVREGVSNGLGVEWWRHLVVRASLPIASFVTIDYGASFVAQPQGCALLATSHEWRTDQLRGEGSYWLARLHVLKDGAMRAVGPEVARRYTHRFAAQRWEGLAPDIAQPLPWFTDVGAFTWPEPETQRTCREASVVFEDDEARFDLGQLGTFEPRGLYREEPLPPEVRQYDRLLDVVTGAPLLDEYRPFGEARWSGRKAVLCEGSSEVTISL